MIIFIYISALYHLIKKSLANTTYSIHHGVTIIKTAIGHTTIIWYTII